MKRLSGRQEWRTAAARAGLPLDTDYFKEPIFGGPRLVPDVVLGTLGKLHVIQWSFPTGVPAGKSADWGPDPEILQRFFEIPEGGPEKVLEFAQMYGVLELCKHDLPYLYPHSSQPCKPYRMESVPAWKAIASQLRALYQIGAALARDETPARGLWRLALGGVPDAQERRRPRDRQREVLGWLLSLWLQAGGARILVDWSPGGRGTAAIPAIVLTAQNALGIVACQMAFSLGRTSALRSCRSCGRLFAPRPANRRYCDGPECGRRGANRVNQRKYQARKRGKQTRRTAKPKGP